MPRYRSNDEFVCGECFGDQGMKDFCSNHAERTECDFCDATGDEPIAAPLDEVIDHIKATIYRYYDDPANSGLPYESAEGGWQGQTWCTYEIFDELGLDFPQDVDSRLHNAISNGLDNDLWSEAEPYALSPTQQLKFSWERFCEMVKHQRRYFFLHEEKKKKQWPNNDELYSPAEILRAIFSFAERAGAFVPLSASTALYRARWQDKGKHYVTAGTLGPPPVDHAIKTNRMSPPGVVMTYAAEDRDTALAETADAPGTYAVGKFVNDRELLILDLTRLPEVPSVFAELPDTMGDPRPQLGFLHSISRDISRPIARDDRVHVEYVPTQIVTEYVRTAVKIGKRKIDGIRYNSSRLHAATALVLFADQSNLILDKDERPDFYRTDDRWLRLAKATEVKVGEKDIQRWAAKPKHGFSLVA